MTFDQIVAAMNPSGAAPPIATADREGIALVLLATAAVALVVGGLVMVAGALIRR